MKTIFPLITILLLSTVLMAQVFDNCPGIYNPDQKDTDHDGIGDACDTTPYGNNGEFTPSSTPTPVPTPTINPTENPSATPTPETTIAPSGEPTIEPSAGATEQASGQPTATANGIDHPTVTPVGGEQATASPGSENNPSIQASTGVNGNNPQANASIQEQVTQGTEQTEKQTTASSIDNPLVYLGLLVAALIAGVWFMRTQLAK